MSEDFISDEIINPDEAYLEKCYMIDYLGDAVRSIDQIYEDIKMN